MQVDFVRHTAVDTKVVSLCYGVTDVALRETFPEEARAVAEFVRPLGEKADEIFTSPLSRARALARFCGYHSAKEDSRIREMDFGDWEMKPWSEILTTDDVPKFFRLYIEKRTPNGESLTDQRNRVKEFLDEQKSEGYRRILVFCHGGVINCARSIILGASLEDAFASLPPYGSVTTLDY